MRRTLRMAGAIACALLAFGLAACDPDDVADVALPVVKATAIKVAVAAAAGDTKARDIMISTLDGYCDVDPVDRAALRRAFAVDARPAVAVDCAVVAALKGRVAGLDAGPPAARPRVLAAVLAPPDPRRRE